MSDGPAARQRFFFVHVPKTAGGTLREHVFANVGRDAVYPNRYGDGVYWKVGALLGLPAEEKRRIRAYVGHFPYAVVELLGGDMITLTILREPVERTLSTLRFRRSVHGLDASLEELYDDEVNFRRLVHNLQTRMFALTADDHFDAYFNILDIDDRRFDIAKANLEKVDVLGFQDRFTKCLGEMRERFGWLVGAVTDQHVTTSSEVPASFRRRITDDNAFDMEFYEHALALERARN